MTAPRWNRLLITGASGRLGTRLRTGLRDLAQHLRVTDVRELGPVAEDEERVHADLGDMASVLPLLQAVDVVIHLGAVMPQAPWDAVLNANIVGSYNLFEAARQAGVKRIVYASSHHAVGMYGTTEALDADSPPRPDTLYGLSKAFGENLARMYHDKHGIEVACLRIGSCFEHPSDQRMLSTWLSHGDMVQLCRRCLEAPRLAYSVVYGVSDNSRRWWHNDKTGFLGFQPQDSADAFDGLVPLDEAPGTNPAARLQGGRFTQLIP